jgi:GntR family transcriptional regulator
MDIVLNRKGGVSLRDQLVAQLELKIVGGDLGPGQRLPSVRALARKLKLHPNTVSAAYRELASAGHVELQRGSGVYVRGTGPSTPHEGRGLDEMIRLALEMAFRKGYSGSEIRAAVEGWLAAVPPERILVVAPSRSMGELLAHEIRQNLDVPLTCVTLEELAGDTRALSGSLALALPYDVESIRLLSPGTAVEPLNIEVAKSDRDALARLPPGSIVLLVTHSPTLLPFASTLVRSLRGEELVVEACLLSEARAWGRLVPAADVVFADALSVDRLKRARPRRLREIRIVPPATLARLREALTIVTRAAKGRA